MKNKTASLTVAFLILGACSQGQQGQQAQRDGIESRGTGFVAAPDRARLALVIGNDAYTHVRPLSNAGNDARLIGGTLKGAGFQLLGGVRTNLDRESMWSAVDQLEARIQKGDEVVVYFAGHGVQIASSAMLLPVDINAERDEQVLHNAISVNAVQDAIKNARFALLVIDACRDNPFPRKAGSTRSIGETRGLAPIEAAEGSAIFMAASRGQRALDMVPGVTANHGLFTYALVQAISTPGLDVRTALYRARDDVVERAKRANYDQRPSLTDEMQGIFAFFPGTTITARTNPVPIEPRISTIGHLRIESQPTAGKVYLDGAYSGTAPLELSDITTGVHTVRVELEGYVPYQQKVRVSSERGLLVQPTLSPKKKPIQDAGSAASPKEKPVQDADSPAVKRERRFSKVSSAASGTTGVTFGQHVPSIKSYYPWASQGSGEEGTSVVKVCVGPDGKRLQKPTIVQSSGSAKLDYAAVRLAEDADYIPATEGGKSVSGCVTVKIEFKLPASFHNKHPAGPTYTPPAGTIDWPRRGIWGWNEVP